MESRHTWYVSSARATWIAPVLVAAACALTACGTASTPADAATDMAAFADGATIDAGSDASICDGYSTLPTHPVPSCTAGPADAGGCIGLPGESDAGESYAIDCQVALPIRAELGSGVCGPTPLVCYCRPVSVDAGPDWICPD